MGRGIKGFGFLIIDDNGINRIFYLSQIAGDLKLVSFRIQILDHKLKKQASKLNLIGFIQLYTKQNPITVHVPEVLRSLEDFVKLFSFTFLNSLNDFNAMCISMLTLFRSPDMPHTHTPSHHPINTELAGQQA